MSKPHVVVMRRIPEAGLSLLRAAADVRVWPEEMPMPRATALSWVAGADGLLTLLTDRVDGALLEAAGPQLKVVSNFAVGFDNVDVDACTRRGIPVGNTPGVLTDATADLAFALLMAAARRLREADLFVRAGQWHTWMPLGFLGASVQSSSIGIIGMGRIGYALARRCAGFDCRILYHNRHPHTQADRLGAELVSLDTLLAQADFVSVHTPLVAETERLIDDTALHKMKRTAILVNTARGKIVDSMALYRALRDGVIAYAALDVTNPEPLPADHPLLTLDNIIVTPHIGSATVATRDQMARLAAENLLAGLCGERLPFCVNPEVYDA